jgi:hypothetical protein
MLLPKLQSLCIRECRHQKYYHNYHRSSNIQTWTFLCFVCVLDDGVDVSTKRCALERCEIQSATSLDVAPFATHGRRVCTAAHPHAYKRLAILATVLHNLSAETLQVISLEHHLRAIHNTTQDNTTHISSVHPPDMTRCCCLD